ncbi:MAG: SDR family NAD(P)-dependent oxidoreductase [Bifidobacteriaceae bacterium]|jgi:short-subunit dehydrogenase|nr:SDR family NAD(P)-dependent oxidoreductase [Bifidobacteriaceae bacterium]
MDFQKKYGQWAVVAGGSEGIGGEFSSHLASQGMNVVVIARRPGKIAEKCAQLEKDYGVKTIALPLDLGGADVLERVKEATAGLDVGFLVYNAGLASLGPVQDLDIDYELYRLNVNLRNALALTLYFIKQFVPKRRGGIVLLSSSGGVVGTPYIQTYSATKAYLFTLAEALWAELSDYGIAVLAVLPGNTIGQQYTDVPPGTPGFQTAREVAHIAFEVFGKQPTVLSGQTTIATVGEYFDIPKRTQGVLTMKQIFTDMMNQYAGVEEDGRLVASGEAPVTDETIRAVPKDIRR